jgi:predicted small metal-binding protein
VGSDDHPSDPRRSDVKRNLTCPCGEHITGTDEDDLVEKVQVHLKEKHPDHDYSRDEILFMAY